MSLSRPLPLRPLFLSLALAALPVAALAQDGGALGALDRETLRAEFRAYLMENPEVIFEAVAEYERRTMAEQADMDTTLVEINADELFNDGFSWVGGNPDGDLTLVEFMDYRCSFCRRAFPEMMDFANADGNIRLVIKEFPILGPQSEVMSRFAVAVHQLAGDEAYFIAHERLLDWPGEVSESGLSALAVDLGLDPATVSDRMRAPEVTEILTQNRALAQRLQISGTPSFALGDGLGGELLRGFLPAAQLQQAAAALRN